MKAAFCVPWRGGDPTREHLWESSVRPVLVRSGLPVYTGDGDPTLPFNRSAARNAAAAQAGDVDVYLFCDADAYVPAEQWRRAANFAHGNDGLALPFSRMKSMNPETGEVRERVQVGNVRYVTSGVVAVSRAVWEQVHFDEQLAGYGWEDGAFLAIASRLAPFAVVPGTLVSFEHARTADEEPEAAIAARPERLLAYDAAKEDPVALRALGRATIGVQG